MKTRDFFSSTVKKLEYFEHEIRLVKDPSRHASLCQQASDWAQRVLPQVDDHLAGMRHEFTSEYRSWGLRLPPEGGDSLVPRVVPAHNFRARMGNVGARLMEAFEAVFNTWLALKIWVLNANLFTAIVVTLATLAFCEGVGRLLALHINKRTEVPEESRERAGRVFVPTLIVWLVAFFFTCVLRVAAGGVADVVGPFTPLVFAVLEIATLILIGVGFAWEELYSWSERAAEDYSRVLDVRHRIGTLILGREAPEPRGQADVAGSPRGGTPQIGFAAALLAAAIFAAMPGRLNAQADPKGSTLVDVSTSTSAAGRAAALEAHRQVIAAAMLKLGISSWSFVQFTDDGWSASPLTVARGRADSSSACGPVKFSENAMLFAPSRQHEIAAAQERCRKEEEHVVNALQGSIDSSINLLLKNNEPKASKCTSVADAVERAARTANLRAATVITDGDENCGPWRHIAPPDHEEQVIVILIPENDDARKRGSEGTLFEKRKERLLKAAPWILVIPAFEFSSDTFSSPAANSLAQNNAAH